MFMATQVRRRSSGSSTLFLRGAPTAAASLALGAREARALLRGSATQGRAAQRARAGSVARERGQSVMANIDSPEHGATGLVFAPGVQLKRSGALAENPNCVICGTDL